MNKKTLAKCFIVGITCLSFGFWLGSERERNRCAVLVLDNTLVETYTVQFFLETLRKDGQREAEATLLRHIDSSFAHLESVLKHEDGFSEFKDSWSGTGYPPSVFYNLREQLYVLVEGTNMAKKRFRRLDEVQ